MTFDEIQKISGDVSNATGHSIWEIDDKEEAIKFTQKIANCTYEEAFEFVDFHFDKIQESKEQRKLNQIEYRMKQAKLPHCPTCNSTKVSKISGTKRFITTGLFGLASSDLGKTMQCGNCGYKW